MVSNSFMTSQCDTGSDMVALNTGRGIMGSVWIEGG